MIPTVAVRRSADLATTTTSWLHSRHSFSFGDHFDPANTHHGLLLANNEATVAPGNGFDTHPHRDTEIVTWVLHGELSHRDSAGNSGVVYPGLAQRMSAGSGVRHSEENESVDTPVHFVQMWIVPHEPGGDPGYQQHDIGADLDRGGLVTITSGMSGYDAAIGLRNPNAALHGARLSPGDAVDLPAAPYLHLFVPRGPVTVDGVGELYDGDAVRFTACDGRRVTAAGPAEILAWQMHASLRG
jgi:redox-sensitive bicupin YhaK (pirin superfamily)